MHNHFENLTLIPADQIIADLNMVPDCPGVYLFFANGGTRLLEATSYFDLDCRSPASLHRRTHLYTGAANDLRLRMKQHFFRDWRSSTFRETLLAIERARKAISKSQTPASNITGEESLSDWLAHNVAVGIRLSKRPFELETQLIETQVSPFNITLRRSHPYSRALMQWRHEAFPRWRHPSPRRAGVMT